MSAERAARRVLRACRQGRAQVVLSAPAKAAALVHGIAPSATTELLSLVGRMLPAPGGIGRTSLPGHASRSPRLPAWLLSLDDEAAKRNNEVAQAPE
jgi:hypothetical protein